MNKIFNEQYFKEKYILYQPVQKIANYHFRIVFE